MKISQYFTLDELVRSPTAAERGIDNTPGPEALANLQRLSRFLDAVRTLLGKPVLISSAYRSPALNKAVGGSNTSAHLSGLAADIKVAGMTPAELARRIVDSDLEFDQVILEFDRWVHVGLASGSLRRQVLTVRDGTGYQQGLV